uniref:Uncharacterized protein n=1 Tax=viral metagenome TaxID=1070528 RepID=A0A6M3JQL4_9ZZZZ
MNIATIKALQELNKRLQGRGFSFYTDDYITLQDGLPELMDLFFNQQSSQQTNTADVEKPVADDDLCPDCGLPTSEHRRDYRR